MREEEARGVILGPVVTEKATNLQEKRNQYTLRVNPRANKIQIRQAAQKLFNVTVADVRVIRVRGKERRIGRSHGFRPAWKKALLTVKEGEKIELK